MAGKGDVISIIKEKYGTMSKSHKTIANFACGLDDNGRHKPRSICVPYIHLNSVSQAL